MAGYRRRATAAGSSSVGGAHGSYRGMNWAYCEEIVARSAWRAAADVEAMVAHWLVQGQASAADLAEARRRVKAAHLAFTRARAVYRREALAAAAERGR